MDIFSCVDWTPECTQCRIESIFLPLQLHTVVDALDILSFSGPVKSIYPLTFIEMNQVRPQAQCLSVLFYTKYKQLWLLWSKMAERLYSVCFLSKSRLGSSSIRPSCLWTAVSPPLCPHHWMESTTGHMYQSMGWVSHWNFPGNSFGLLQVNMLVLNIGHRSQILVQGGQVIVPSALKHPI